MRTVSDQLCLEHGLTTLKPYQQNRHTKGLRTGEYRAAIRGERWKFRLITTVEAVMECATRESLEPLATGAQLVDWLEQADEIHREICRELHQTISEIKEKQKQDGKQREEFMKQLSEQAKEFRGDGAELMNTFRRWAARTILSSAAAAVVISILICRLLT